MLPVNPAREGVAGSERKGFSLFVSLSLSISPRHIKSHTCCIAWICYWNVSGVCFSSSSSFYDTFFFFQIAESLHSEQRAAGLLWHSCVALVQSNEKVSLLFIDNELPISVSMPVPRPSLRLPASVKLATVLAILRPARPPPPANHPTPNASCVPASIISGARTRRPFVRPPAL